MKKNDDVTQFSKMVPEQLVLSGEDFDKFTAILEEAEKSPARNRKLEKLFSEDTLFGKELIMD